jgi:hypothetical protein
MFWSSPSADLQISIFLTIVAFFIAIIFYLSRRKFLLSIFVFSLLSNLVFYFSIDYNLAKIYNIFWFKDIIRSYWPILNIILLVILIFQLLQKNKIKK